MNTLVDDMVKSANLCLLNKARHAPVRLTSHGFTFVELITVIILLGILSVTVLPRLIKPSAFAPSIISHALVAEGRIAQQLAISRVDAIVSLWIDRTGDEWRFRINTDVDGLVRVRSFTAYNTTLQATSGAATDTISITTPVSITFSHSGDIAAVQIGANSGDATMGVDFQLSGDSNRQACLYASGYTTDAACS